MTRFCINPGCESESAEPVGDSWIRYSGRGLARVAARLELTHQCPPLKPPRCSSVITVLAYWSRTECKHFISNIALSHLG